jgi:hypothetical protein
MRIPCKSKNYIPAVILFLPAFAYGQSSFQEIENSRIPSLSSISVSPGCGDKVKQRLEQFKDGDLANSRLLQNQLKSHQEGWVEYSPGTCEAGGPPPLCPVNHWYRDPNSMSKWNEEQARVKADRENQVRELANSCNTAYKQAEFNKQQELQQQQQQQQQVYDQKVLAQSEQNKLEMENLMKEQGDRMLAGIQDLKDQITNSMIGFKKGAQASTDNGNGSLPSADDYTPDVPNGGGSSDLQDLQIMQTNIRLFDYESYSKGNPNECDDCFASTTSKWQDVKEYIGDQIKDWVKDKSLEYLSDKYPALQGWYETYNNYSPMVGMWVSNIQSVAAIDNAAICLLNKSLDAFDNNDASEETETRNWNEFNQSFAYALPVVGKLAKGYNTLMGIYAKGRAILAK